MNDLELISAWTTLEPTSRRRARIETRVFEWLEASQSSIVGEWLGLLKVEPLSVLVYAVAGAVSLVLLTPIGWMTAWLVP
jgi:hypothetical protein